MQPSLRPEFFGLRSQERTDVEANAVVDVRLPADRLTIQRLPAHEDVVGRIALDDPGQFAAQVLGGDQTRFRAGFAGRKSATLPADPFTEVAVAEFFEQAAASAVALAEPMIVDERREAAAGAIPDVPDERRLVEQPAMAVEELVGEPRAEIGGVRFFRREHVADRVFAIVRPPDGADQVAQTRRRIRFAGERRQRIRCRRD